MTAVEMANAEKPDLVLLTRRLRLPQPALPRPADRGDARLRGAGDRGARQPRSLVGRRRGQARARARRRRGAAQPAHDDHAAPRAPAGRRPRRRVHRPRAPRRGGEGPAPRHPEHRPLAHRRGGGRPVAARACRWCSRATRTPVRSRSRACTSSRSARIGGHRYVHGLYGSRRHANHRADDEAAGAVYVGAGIGAAVVPLRLGDRGKREVTMFELGCEPGDFVEHHAEQEPLHGPQADARTIAKRAAAVVRKRLRRERGVDLTSRARLTSDVGRAPLHCMSTRDGHLNAHGHQQKYTLPDLPYDYGALEPHISGKIMQLHHDKHHRAYVDEANEALDGLAEARAKNDFSQDRRAGARARVQRLGARAAFAVLAEPGAEGGRRADGALAEQIKRDFGELRAFRAVDQRRGDDHGFGLGRAVVGSAEQAPDDHADSRSPVRDHPGRDSDAGARRLGARLLPAVRPRQEELTSRRSGTSGTGPTPGAVSKPFAAPIWPCARQPDHRRPVLVEKSTRNFPCGEGLR